MVIPSPIQQHGRWNAYINENSYGNNWFGRSARNYIWWGVEDVDYSNEQTKQ